MHDRAGALAERVLVDVDDLGIAEDAEREIVEPAHVAAVEQRGSHQAPERHERVLLVGRQRAGRRLALAAVPM